MHLRRKKNLSKSWFVHLEFIKCVTKLIYLIIMIRFICTD